jgi:hypothetical protein
MKCRKAFDLDLADFVVEPSSEAWADFRAHYPGCEDCVAEVAVWDEMQAFLRSGGPGPTTAHPPKELLLRYEEQRSTLSAIEAAMLGKHLGTCPTCPDEIAALRTFDFSVLRRHPSPRPQPWWTLVVDVVSWIRLVVLHPAFAYALVLTLLYPALLQLRFAGRSRPTEQIALELPRTVAHQQITTNGDRPEVMSPPPSTEHIAGAPPNVGAAQQEPRPLRPDDRTRTVARDTAPPTDENAQLAAASTRPRRAASRHAQPAELAAVDRAPTDRAVDNAPAAKAPPVADHDENAADELEETVGSDALVHGEPADGDSSAPRVLGLADTEEPHDDARHARRTAKGAGATQDDAARDASWQTLVLAPGHSPVVQRADLVTGVILRVPPADRDVEIRVVGPGGREVARETARSLSGEPVEVRIGATELVAGTYRVLTRRLDGSTSSEPTSELLFSVR